MRIRCFASVLIAPCLLAQASETPLTAVEKAAALRELDAAHSAFLQATAGLSPAQWAFKPAPDRWSIAECAEHLTVMEGAIHDGIIVKGLKAPIDGALRAAAKLPDARLAEVMADRSRKFTAPEFAQPTGRWKTEADLLAAYEVHHAGLVEDLKSSAQDWRARYAPHPFFGQLDLYQWTLLAAAHTSRHVQQIEEVKRAPGYPKD